MPGKRASSPEQGLLTEAEAEAGGGAEGSSRVKVMNVQDRTVTVRQGTEMSLTGVSSQQLM